MKRYMITWFLAILLIPGLAWAGEKIIQGDLHLYIDDPCAIFQGAVSGDTGWWTGAITDAEGDDDDPFNIGRGTTKGSNILLTLSRDGNLSVTGTISGTSYNISGLTASRAVQTDASKNLESSSVTNTELGYLSGVTSGIQGQLDARCLESVFGDAIGLGLTLDGTTLKTHAALQSIAGLTETNGGLLYGTADNTYAWLAAGAANRLFQANGAAAPSWVDSIDLAGTITAGGNVTLDGTDPSLIFDGDSAGDLDGWIGLIQDDSGDTTGDYIGIGTGTTPGTNTKMVVDSSGNVGIGTAIPNYRLHLYTTAGGFQQTLESGASNSFAAMKIQNTYNSGTGKIDLYSFANNYSGNIRNLGVNAMAEGAWIYSGGAGKKLLIDQNGAGQIHFATNGAIRATVNENGNVGIGTTSPGYELEVTGDVYVSGDVSALTFTDRTPYFDGDALAAIKNIKGKDGEIDHATLPEFARRTLQRKETETVLGERIPIDQTDAWEEYEETETVYDEDANGKRIVEKIKTIYREKDGQIVAERKPVYKSHEVTVPKKRLKEGVNIDPDTGELYNQESSEVEHVISEEPGRDLGAMVSILTQAVQQLTARIEQLEAAK